MGVATPKGKLKPNTKAPFVGRDASNATATAKVKKKRQKSSPPKFHRLGRRSTPLDCGPISGHETNQTTTATTTTTSTAMVVSVDGAGVERKRREKGEKREKCKRERSKNSSPPWPARISRADSGAPLAAAPERSE